MINEVSFDQSEGVQIKARVNEAGVPRVIKFQNTDLSPFDISSQNFQLVVLERAGGKVVFTLGVGTGLTVQGASNDELLITLTKTNATRRIGTYFWYLRSITNDHTWLSGDWIFHNTSNHNNQLVTNVTINTSEVFIKLTISGGSGGSGGGAVQSVTGEYVNNTDPANPQIQGINTALGNKADLVGGKVPASQLPAHVDDIIEVDTFLDLPPVGVTGVLYVTLSTNIVYRWTGSTYVEVSASLALGETLATAYRGDRGKIAYDFSQLFNLIAALDNDVVQRKAGVFVSRTMLQLLEDLKVPEALYFQRRGQSRYLTLTNGTIGNTSTGNGTTSFLRAYPFIIPRKTKLSGVNLTVTTLVAGGLMNLALYKDDGNCYPADLIAESVTSNYDCSTTGVKTFVYPTPIELEPGLYWQVQNANNSIGYRSPGLAQMQNILQTDGQAVTNAGSYGLGWNIASPFANGYPSTFPAGATLVTGSGGLPIMAGYKLEV